MRNLFMICVATLLLSLTGFAQQRKGKWLVGGGFDFVSRTGTPNNPALENKSSYGSVSPKVGYFFADRWAAGLTASLSFNNSRDSTETRKGRGYNLAAFVRYYQHIGEKLALFGELNAIDHGAGRTRRNPANSTQDRIDTYRC